MAFVIRYSDTQAWATGNFSFPQAFIQTLPLNEWRTIRVEGGLTALDIQRTS